MESVSCPQNVPGETRKKISKLVDNESILKEIRRKSEDKGLNIRVPWKESNLKFVGSVTEANGEAHFVTGSKYMGTWDADGMAGVGRYTMSHGVTFEGELRNGVFHGHGTLEWPQKQRIDGVWLRGKLQEKRYTFADGLVYQEKDWNYCQFPDRRYYQCIKEGLNPARRTLKTAKQPSPVIPPSCYDTGDGIFHPNISSVTSYKIPHKVLRITSEKEATWIIENCRKEEKISVGYKPWLNENWLSDPPDLPYSLPMSNDSPQPWWKRLTTFVRNVEVKAVNEEPVLKGEDISYESRQCYEFRSSEESHNIVAKTFEDNDCPCMQDEICLAFRNGKSTTEDFVVNRSQTVWKDDFSKRIQDNSSDSTFRDILEETEKQKFPRDTESKDLSLTKLEKDAKDERLKEDDIEESEGTEEELVEIMTKSKEEKVLRNSSKQEMNKKNKEVNTTEKKEETERVKELVQKGSYAKKSEEDSFSESYEERKNRNESQKALQEGSEKEDELNSFELLSDKGKKHEDDQKTGKSLYNEDKIEVLYLKSTGSGEYVNGIEREDELNPSALSDKERKKHEEDRRTKNTLGEEDESEVVHLKASEEREYLDETERAQNQIKSSDPSDKEREMKGEEKRKKASDSIERGSIAKTQYLQVIEDEDDEAKKGAEHKLKSSDLPEEVIKEKEGRTIDSVHIKGIAEANSFRKTTSSEEINEDKVGLFSHKPMLQSLPIKSDQKFLKTKSSPELHQKKCTSDKERQFCFSVAFDPPRSKPEFSKEICHSNVNLKDGQEGCVPYSKKNRVSPCKQKKAIEMVHLRLSKKRCHE